MSKKESSASQNKGEFLTRLIDHAAESADAVVRGDVEQDIEKVISKHKST